MTRQAQTHARSVEVVQSRGDITQEGKRTAVAAFPFFTQSGAAVVVVVVRCLDLRSGLHRAYTQGRVANGHAVN